MYPHRRGGRRFMSLRLYQNGVDQRRHGLFIQSECRHIRHRATDRQRQFSRRFPHRSIIKAHGETIAASTADVTAPAGELCHQALSRLDLQGIAKGKPGVFPGPQSGMGDIFPFRHRVATMAAAAPSPLRMMGGMA